MSFVIGVAIILLVPVYVFVSYKAEKRKEADMKVIMDLLFEQQRLIGKLEQAVTHGQ